MWEKKITSFHRWEKEEGDTSDKLSNQFLQLKAVVAFRRYLLIYGLDTTTAQLQSFFFNFFFFLPLLL